MSYLHADGSPDTLEEILESARCFAIVIGKLLQPNEGMVVELKFQEEFPNDKYGKYLIWNDDVEKLIKVDLITSEHELYNMEEGQMVWVHTQLH